MIEKIVFILFMTFLLVSSLIDLKYKIIPNKLVLFGLMIGIIAMVLGYQGYDIAFASETIGDSLLGSLTAFTIMFLIAILTFVLGGSQGMLGMGDVKMLIPIGLYLGLEGAMHCIFSAFLIGGLVSSLLVILRIKNLKSHIPFGPFISLGVLITFVYT